MSVQTFCIDFGSSFTKVGLRIGPSEPSWLIEHKALDLDPLHVCVPTVIAVDQSTLFEKAIWGAKAVDLVDGNGVKVYRNWKPLLFASTTSTLGPLETLLSSADFASLAEKYAVPREDLERLRTEARTPRKSVTSKEDHSAGLDTAIRSVAVTFFRELRRLVLDSCAERRVPAADKIPARVCVPEFCHEEDGGITQPERRILEILSEAGWKLIPDRDKPVLSEPEANAIGVLTGGSNAIWQPLRRNGEWVVNLGEMFKQGPLGDAIRAKRTTYFVMLIDVGTYTTDYAYLRFDTDGAFDNRPSVFDRSIPLGVRNLDEAVQAALPPQKAEWFRRVETRKREACKNLIYTEAQPYATRNKQLGDIGNASEMPIIREVVSGFAYDLADRTDEFCVDSQINQLDAVILTGGGNNIPAVQEALTALVKRLGGPSCSICVPERPRTSPRTSAKTTISRQLIRGATAIGGASVYFERGDYY
jgi:hypothetical protein